MIRNAFLAAALASALALPASAADLDLPKSMVWSAYDLGSSGHGEATGIANALRKNYGTRIRIIPSGTSIGRMLPMVTGKVTYGFLGNEAFFSTEGIYDYAAEQWGPQNMRVLLGRVATVGLAAANDVGIKTVADFKGKRIGYVQANPSINVKTDAMLSFGGLTRGDVDVQMFSSYGAMKTALLANQIDIFMSVTTSAVIREVEASPRGLYWVEFPPENQAGWDAVTGVISFAGPMRETRGAGLSDSNAKWLVGYRYPVLSVYQDKVTTDEVYNMVKAIDLSFDDFKNTTSSSFNWALEKSGRPPYDAPAHDGTVRYMKEKGLWRDADQAWQEKRLARLNTVLEAWENAQADFHDWRGAESAKGNKVDAKSEWPNYWEDYRAKRLK